ncbi:DUF4190 domain-containing protein [Microbacterium sp. p3-SID336]|uniref:DUF4190 domain-containing protein n=1 Tax=Microbacterium sp. p3-SID336 TaxID=2916212 RepID=UPI0021A7A0D8|nr:DUF4190 domain-containing protein [Microbacterium sp. p3-SID336]MCT1476765.1 hypothetical protein [Microbacterium sp. p3-SID336]
MSTTSFALGIVSVLCGFLFVVPILGLIFGIIGKRREPAGTTLAVWGIVLNAVVLVGWIVLLILLIVTGAFTVIFRQ